MTTTTEPQTHAPDVTAFLTALARAAGGEDLAGVPLRPEPLRGLARPDHRRRLLGEGAHAYRRARRQAAPARVGWGQDARWSARRDYSRRRCRLRRPSGDVRTMRTRLRNGRPAAAGLSPHRWQERAPHRHRRGPHGSPAVRVKDDSPCGPLMLLA